MSNFYFYTCFGLNIKSKIKLPELKNSDTKKYDVEIGFKDQKSFSNCDCNDSVNYNFFLENKPLFKVKYGKVILINSDFRIDDILLRSLILGQGMGILLHQRGYLVLHGSSVKICNKAVAFIGHCGDGKSTIAASLNSKGYPFITDDILVIDFKNKVPLVLPSFPRIKLWDDILKLIKDDKECFQKIHPKYNKYSYVIEENFCENPTPLKTIYVIEKGEDNCIIPLSNQNALIELIKQSYMLNLFNNYEKNLNLTDCARLVENVLIKNLNRGQYLDSIDDLINIVENDIDN